MSDKTELLPCPFCGPKADEGSRVVLLNERESDGYVRGYTVRCDHCGIELHDEYESDVVAAWNRRSSVQEAAPAGDLTETAKRIAWAHWRTVYPRDICNTADRLWECLNDENRVGYLSAARAVAPAGVPEGVEDCIGHFTSPMGLHPDTALLVAQFASALAAKLHKAERKYGYSDGWRRGDWRDELVAKLVEHVHKGDPRDVAAYCAFAWHHQWSVAPAAPTAQGQGWQDIASAPREGRIDVRVITTYRWLPYKPSSGLPQRGFPGRWQRATEHGWENSELPESGDWRPNLPSASTSAGEA